MKWQKERLSFRYSSYHLGELFTIRVAGNVLTTETLASIEYAITELKTRLIVILGHENCGAVKAAVSTPKGTGDQSDLQSRHRKSRLLGLD